MGLADLHIHTLHSWDGTSSVAGVLKYVADHSYLDVIAITDHDEIAGALHAAALAPEYGIEVIPGCEISTGEGHLLALNIREKIQPGLSLIETALQVAGQGGFCVVAHPMAPGTSSATPETIRQALDSPQISRVLLGLETFNAGLVVGNSNAQASRLAASVQVAQVGNSDAHVLSAIGTGATEFAGSTAQELLRALQERTTRVVYGNHFRVVDILSSWLPRYLLKRAGWVAWNAAPQAPLVLARTARTLAV